MDGVQCELRNCLKGASYVNNNNFATNKSIVKQLLGIVVYTFEKITVSFKTLDIPLCLQYQNRKSYRKSVIVNNPKIIVYIPSY